MTGNVSDKVVKRFCLTKYVTHNKFLLFSVVNYHLARAVKCLPSGIQIMNEDNEYNWSIDWAGGHHEVYLELFGPAKASLAREDLATWIWL